MRGSAPVYLKNCYLFNYLSDLQPGDQQNLKERTKRVIEIARDRQDPNAPIAICGEFNNLLAYIEQVGTLNFTAALELSTETHKLGGHLD